MALLPESWRNSPTLAPFHSRIFSLIWTASLVSNFGSLIQTVGASWLMTSIAPGTVIHVARGAIGQRITAESLPQGGDPHDGETGAD